MSKKLYLELQDWTYEEGLGGIYYLRNNLGQVLAEHFSNDKNYALNDLVKDYNKDHPKKISEKDIVILAKM